MWWADLKHKFHFSAPTDVLEALNRVLDDNRELFIPETQTLIKAHTNFRLFATQNPTGSYGGRKPLSRAFRNRFVELHFDELPHQELSEIIEKRAGIARSQSVKLVDVLRELQMIRRESATFKGKYSFLTLRDLFRWAFRCSNFKVCTYIFPLRSFHKLRLLKFDSFWALPTSLVILNKLSDFFRA